MTTIGIDFGTTNTVVASEGVVRRIGDATTLATCVALTPAGKAMVGAAARDRLTIDPENTICSFKRILGRTWSSPLVTAFRGRHQVLMRNDLERGVVFQTRAGAYSATDLAAIVIEAAVRGAGFEPSSTSAVITVPVALGPVEREATLQAGLKAGLRNVELMEEPIAAAMAHREASISRYAAVYDVGGGTFDLCVLDTEHWPIGILGHGGDLSLGGDDFDEALAADVAATLLKQYNWDLRTNVGAFQRLVAFAEKAKIELSKRESTTLDLEEVDPAMPVQLATLTLDRAVLARSCYNLVRRTFATCDAVFKDLDVTPRDLDRLYLAGGATQMPLVRDWVTTYFGIKPAEGPSPFEVVALGASLAAKEAFASR